MSALVILDFDGAVIVASYFPVELLSVSVYVCPLMTVCTVFTAIIFPLSL